MANITRYDPFGWDDTLDQLLRGVWLRPLRPDTGEPAQIRLEVAEDDKAYIVQAEIPGVKKEDIHVSIEGNQVAISAEVKNEKEVKEGEKVLRSERYYGKVYRGFTLGQDVDDHAAKARYADGVLELVLPKKAASQARKLEIG